MDERKLNHYVLPSPLSAFREFDVFFLQQIETLMLSTLIISLKPFESLSTVSYMPDFVSVLLPPAKTDSVACLFS